MQKKLLTKKQVVTAILLGDGHLTWDIKSSHYGMDSVSGIQEKDYMEWKHKIFEEYTGLKCNINTYKNSIRKDVVRMYIWNKKFIEPYHKFLYTQSLDGRYKKKLKNFLHRMNHPMCLAIWFMDVGSCQGHKCLRKDGKRVITGYTLYLGTNSFDYSDHEYMVAWFKKEFGVEPKIGKVKYTNPKHCAYGKTQYRLVFNKLEAEKLYKLMEEYIVPIKSMRHKFRFAYHLTTKKGSPFEVDFEIN